MSGKCETFVRRLMHASQRRFGLVITRVVSRPLDGAAELQASLDDVRYNLVNEAEVLRHCADAELELSERSVRAAFSRGDLCVAAMHGEKLIGYQWVAFGSTPHTDGIWVQFNQASCYVYKRFVRTAYRGRRIAAGLSRHADAVCAERGRLSAVGFITLCNDASWRASGRVGGRTLGYAGYLQWRNRFVSLRSAGARRSDFRFYKPAPVTSEASRPRSAILTRALSLLSLS